MSRRRNLISLFASSALLLGVQTASAGDPKDPKFEYGKQEEVKKAEWKASAQAGVISTTGNSRATSGGAGAKASRKAGNNKLSMEAMGAYARSSILIAVDDGDGIIENGEVTRSTSTTTRAWAFKGRYDRFLTKHNSLYATASVSGDKPAGKEFVGGGQFGYSRQLFKSAKHEVVAEAGYDFSYENPVVGDGVSIHSGRFFVGYEGALTKDTGLTGSLESLHNVNTLDTSTGEVSAFEDTRINTTLAITTKVFEDISFRFGFTSKWDNAPSARPLIGGLPYADGYSPLAYKHDTKTEATLIINFL